MSNDQPKPPELGAKRPDQITAVVRSVAGAVPWIGSALSEIITAFVPNQRLARLETYVLYLQQELSNLNTPGLEERLKAPEGIDLIEDGAYQAVRALNEERTRYIARCVAEGIGAERHDHLREKRILSLLAELDDEEILILDAYAARGIEQTEKFQKLHPRFTFPLDDGDRTILFDASVDKLTRLSLIDRKVRMDQKAAKTLKLHVPEMDRFGRPAMGARYVTALGYVLLERIGLHSRRTAAASK